MLNVGQLIAIIVYKHRFIRFEPFVSRNNRSQGFCRIAILRNHEKSSRKHLQGVSFIVKLWVWIAKFTLVGLDCRYFPVNLVKSIVKFS